MSFPRFPVLTAALLTAALAASRLVAQDVTAVVLLDRYLRGDYASVVASLESVTDFDAVLGQLARDGRGWIEIGQGPDRERRRLVAATVALEAARVHEWTAWKVLTIDEAPWAGMLTSFNLPGQPPVYGGDQLTIRHQHWKSSALLLEWGCALLRDAGPASPGEHLWQLAAMSVAERSEDFEFVMGDPAPGENYNTDPLQHIRHVEVRFGGEARFKLAKGIVLEWKNPVQAALQFRMLRDDIDVAGEATMRLGGLALREQTLRVAGVDRLPLYDPVDLFERTETLTRDPWVIYLARYFKGQALEQKHRTADAERAYRGALAAVPFAQSASVALASLVFRDGRRTEAANVIDAMLRADPRPADPWRGYADADDRFWPELIQRLRAEMAR